MAFDFPNSPSVGQRVTGVGGIVYVWDGVKWASNIGSVTAQSMGDVGRNLLHNPLFNVAQRGAGPWTTSVYTLDRWAVAINSDTVSIAQQPLADGYRASIGDEAAEYALSNAFTGNAAASACNYIVQRTENARRLAGKTVTVSFWALTTTAPKLGVNLYQNCGTGGSPSAGTWLTAQSVTLTGSFARYSMTFAVPSLSGKTLGTAGDHGTWLTFWYSSGATNNAIAGNIGVQSGGIWLWGVQLEIGSVATPLEKPDPRYDLANCSRFFQVTTVTSRMSLTVPASIAVPSYWAQMRTTPTATLSSGATRGNVTAVVLSPYNQNSGALTYNSVAAGDAYILNDIWTLSADL